MRRTLDDLVGREVPAAPGSTRCAAATAEGEDAAAAGEHGAGTGVGGEVGTGLSFASVRLKLRYGAGCLSGAVWRIGPRA